MEERMLEDAIRAAGMDPELVDVENAVTGKVVKLKMKEPSPKEPEPPVKKRPVFKWQESLREITDLMKTGRRPEKEPVPKEKKIWKWGELQKGPEESKPAKKKPLAPVDYSYTGMEGFDTGLPVNPRANKEQPKRDKRGLFVTTSARFTHNQIASLSGFDSFLEARFADPSRIEWLDLSYNKICEIEPVLSMLPKLKTLYLHCNCLDDLDEVRKLRYITSLQCVTLYGNPVEAFIDYRLKMVAALPGLKKLDWGLVTPVEREMAKRYRSMMEEREIKEIEELKREELAAADRREKQLKAEEKRRRREQEQKTEANKERESEETTEHIGEKEGAEELKEIVKNIEEDSKDLKYDVAEIIEEPEEEPLEEVATESEFEEIILPADLAESGPLDVKAKHKLHPDPLTSIAENVLSPCVSATSLFSTETVTLDEIRQEFQLLKELEANMDPEYY